MMPALFQTQFYGLGIYPKIEETKTPLQNLYSSAGERNNNKTNQSVVENAGKPQVPWKEKKRTEVRGLELWWFHGCKSHVTVSDKVLRVGLMVRVRCRQTLEGGDGVSQVDTWKKKVPGLANVLRGASLGVLWWGCSHANRRGEEQQSQRSKGGCWQQNIWSLVDP